MPASSFSRFLCWIFIFAASGIIAGCTKSDVAPPTPPASVATTPAPAPATINDHQPTSPEESAPVAPAPPVNLIVNGSFEEGPDPGQWREIDVGPIGVRGWVVTGKIDVIGSFWKAAHGKRSLDLNGPANAEPGGLKQKFPTQPGRVYYVVFSLAGNLFAGPTVKGLEVRAAGQTKSFSFDTTGRSGDNMGWSVQSWEFTADAAESTLEFVSTVTEQSGAGPALDHVWVSEANPPDDVYHNRTEPAVAAITPVTPQPAPLVTDTKTNAPTPPIIAPEEKDGDPRDLDVTYIERLPRYDYDAPKNNPEPGDKVTFRGHIRAWGPPPKNAAYRWELDGQPLSKGALDDLKSGEDRVLTQDWVWQTGPHTIALIVDPDNKVIERSEVNNRITDRTDGLSVGFWVEESLLAYYHEHQHRLGLGANSWEDWAQRHIRAWNVSNANAIWPLTPEGVTDRVRLDKITVVPDGALPLHGGLIGNNPDRTDKTVDLMWGFDEKILKRAPIDYVTNPDSGFRFDGGLIHELGHARYLIDHYDQDVSSRQILIEEKGTRVTRTEFMRPMKYDVVYYNQHGAIMTGRWGEYKGPWSPAEAYALNRIAGQRARSGNQNAPGNFGEYRQDLPEKTILTFVSGRGEPQAGADIRIYIAKPKQAGEERPMFRDPPKFTFITNNQGQITLPKDLFAGSADKCKTAILRVETRQRGLTSFRFLEIIDLNMEYWRGHKEEGRITFEIQPVWSLPKLDVWGHERLIARDDNTPDPGDRTDFGDTRIDGDGTLHIFAMRNRGDKPLKLSAIVITGSHSDDFVIAYGQTDQVFSYSMEALHIRFKPRATGRRTATVEIHCDEKDKPVYKFAIAGNGLPK